MNTVGDKYGSGTRMHKSCSGPDNEPGAQRSSNGNHGDLARSKAAM